MRGFAKSILLKGYNFDLILAFLGVSNENKLGRVKNKMFVDCINLAYLLEKIDHEDGKLLHLDELVVLVAHFSKLIPQGANWSHKGMVLVECADESFVETDLTSFIQLLQLSVITAAARD